MLMFTLICILSCGPEKDTAGRPYEPWVFRSVLDLQPRMLTIALHEDLWLAYDVPDAGLYKAWKGGVSPESAANTMQYGPQPTTREEAVYINPGKLEKTPWRILADENVAEANIEYLGYQFDRDRMTINYQIAFPGGGKAFLSETPEYFKPSGEEIGLEREFAVKELPVNTILALKLSVENDVKLETNGEIKDGMLLLKGNGLTTIKAVFKIPRGKAEGEIEDEVGTSKVASGLEMMNASDCATCHNQFQKTVGPSYQSIAEKYEPNEENIEMLASKIIDGGSGVWGEVPMSPHPNMSQDDAEAIVEYILSLRPEEETKMKPGVALRFYYVDEELITLTPLRPGQNPNATKIVSRIDLKGPRDFRGFLLDRNTFESDIPLPYEPHFLLDVSAQIDIPKSANYAFRLISSGGARLTIDGEEVLSHERIHTTGAREGQIELAEGSHELNIKYFDGGVPPQLTLLWMPHGSKRFTVVPNNVFMRPDERIWSSFGRRKVVPYKNIPGDGEPVAGVHPSLEVIDIRPGDFKPKVGAIDFLDDERLLLTTWDSLGAVYLVDGVLADDPSEVKVKRIAQGLHEPLGLKVVDGRIYVMQKQELTELIDHDGDEIIDEYRKVNDNWGAGPNFHEFGFGLEQKDGFLYGALATAVLNGGAAAVPMHKDRGKPFRINLKTEELEFLASGLRTPNGIGIGIDDEIFITDNQGDWLPASKLVHLQEGAFYGMRAVDPEATKDLEETPPVVWLPQAEIGNSPTEPTYFNYGPYAGQMIFPDLTHGGIKRVFAEKVDGKYQGVAFRFSQGLEAGMNRLVWGPDGDLYLGGIGNPGNWNHPGGKWYGLQKVRYDGDTAFEMLAVRAKTDGIEIEFTEALGLDQGNSPRDYTVRQWWYKPTPNYGGPKMDEEALEIKSVNVSEDRKKVFLELGGMKEGHLIYVHTAPLVSLEKRPMWSTEAWYTMNNIPEGNPGFRTDRFNVGHNAMTEQERASGWKLLFDGRSLEGWMPYGGQSMSEWGVEDGTLRLTGGEKVSQDIITEEAYRDFDLKLEWKISPGGNSGVFYGVEQNEEAIWKTAMEMQIIDNDAHEDAEIKTHRAGDLYDLIDASINTVNRAGKWNSARIIKNGAHVEHWLNGHKIVEYELGSEAFEKLVEKSKFKDYPDFGKSGSGHIGLQDHGDEVWFRNIKVRPMRGT